MSGLARKTTSTSPRRTRETIQVGRSSVNRSDLQGLRRAWGNNHLVLFLGAGISLDHGIPSWKNLVLEMLSNQTEHAARMRALFPNYRRTLSSWLADYFEYNPVILARMIEDDIRQHARRKRSREDDRLSFLETIRRHLYASVKSDPTGTTLVAIADFIKRSKGHIPAIVTFNFDDLLERELRKRRGEHTSVHTAARVGHAVLPIIHPHGLIPQVGDLTESNVIFTERHYHQLMETMFHWALTEIVSHLRHHTVLFLGLSMSDPNIRRLLDACRNSEIPPHWQVQKRHEIRDHERLQVAQDVERRAREWGTILGNEYIKEPRELLDVIDATLRQADTYDRQLFERMGVKTIWLSSFADIGILLEKIVSARS